MFYPNIVLQYMFHSFLNKKWIRGMWGYLGLCRGGKGLEPHPTYIIIPGKVLSLLITFLEVKKSSSIQRIFFTFPLKDYFWL